jgi:hypothetical protein
MSLLSKILLFVNLLALGGFAYLAVQDWKGRQTITASGLRHVLLLQGLPLGDAQGDPTSMPADPETEIPFRVEMAGGQFTETVGPKVLQAYFQPAGGAASPAAGVSLASNQPVPNQLAEVRQVYDRIKAAVGAADGAKARTNLLGNWLYFQPETYDERAEILDLIEKQNVGELERRLYGKFDAVLNPPRPPDVTTVAPAAGETAEKAIERRSEAAKIRAGGVADEAERRARLAHLLVHLDRDPAWQKRVMMVVGMRRYVSAVGEQAIRFRDMIDRVDKLIRDDQDAFVQQLVQHRTLAIERTQMVRDVAEVKAKLQDQKAKDQEFVSQRETQLMTLRTRLAGIKAEVDALLVDQGKVEQQLFAIQREVGLALEEVYGLETKLRARQEAAAKQGN